MPLGYEVAICALKRQHLLSENFWSAFQSLLRFLSLRIYFSLSLSLSGFTVTLWSSLAFSKQLYQNFLCSSPFLYFSLSRPLTLSTSKHNDSHYTYSAHPDQRIVALAQWRPNVARRKCLFKLSMDFVRACSDRHYVSALFRSLSLFFFFLSSPSFALTSATLNYSPDYYLAN